MPAYTYVPKFMPEFPVKVMDHAEYPQNCKLKTDAELRFIIADAQAAQEANPNNLNNSYYADEVCYAAAELRRRGIK